MAIAMKDCREERNLPECWWLNMTVTETAAIVVAMAVAVIMVMAESVAIAMADPRLRPWP